MKTSKTIDVAMVVNSIAAGLYILATLYAKTWAEIASWLFFGTAVFYLVAVVAHYHARGKRQNEDRGNLILRIQEKGTYRLTREFVALASEPVKFLDVGFIFQVTEVADGDCVVFIPEFGGWTYWEIPAEPTQQIHG